MKESGNAHSNRNSNRIRFITYGSFGGAIAPKTLFCWERKGALEPEHGSTLSFSASWDEEEQE